MLLQGNSSSIAQKSSEIWTVQTDLQPIPFKSDRLLGHVVRAADYVTLAFQQKGRPLAAPFAFRVPQVPGERDEAAYTGLQERRMCRVAAQLGLAASTR
jgi:hypothetical protein